MIPFLMFHPRFVAGTSNAYFDPGVHQETMGTGDSMQVNFTYNNPGVNIDRVSFKVKVGGVTTEWTFASPGVVDFTITGATFSSSSTGWVGAELYEFWFEGRDYPGGSYNQISNSIFLLVS